LKSGHLNAQRAKLLQNGNVKCFVENSPKTTEANVNKKRWQLALAPVNKTVPAASCFFCFFFCLLQSNYKCKLPGPQCRTKYLPCKYGPKKKNIYIYKKNTFRPGLCFSLSVQEQLNEKYLQMQRSICLKSL